MFIVLNYEYFSKFIITLVNVKAPVAATTTGSGESIPVDFIIYS